MTERDAITDAEIEAAAEAIARAPADEWQDDTYLDRCRVLARAALIAAATVRADII